MADFMAFGSSTVVPMRLGSSPGGSNGVRVRNAVAMFAVLFVASGSAQVAMELKLVVAAADSMLLFVCCLS